MNEEEIKKIIKEKSSGSTRRFEKLVFSDPCGILGLENIFWDVFEKYLSESRVKISPAEEGETVKYSLAEDGSFAAVSNYRSKNPASRIIILFFVPDVFISANLNTDYFEPCIEVEIKSEEQKRIDRIFYLLTDFFAKNSCELLQISS